MHIKDVCQHYDPQVNKIWYFVHMKVFEVNDNE